MNDLAYMNLALEQARAAEANDDVPVGAVVVDAGGNVLAVAGNRREQDHDPTAHAEVIALRLAAAKRGHWNLSGCRLYVTLEPCPMCAGATMLARIETIIYGTKDPKGGAESLGIKILQNDKLNHTVKIQHGIQAEAAKSLLQNFFRKKRATPAE